MESPLARNSEIYQPLLELKVYVIIPAKSKAGLRSLDQLGLKFVTLLPYLLN